MLYGFFNVAEFVYHFLIQVVPKYIWGGVFYELLAIAHYSLLTLQ
jgi:hypothetical protein